jgi:hypothetical protein
VGAAGFKAGLSPTDDHDLPAVRVLGSAGVAAVGRGVPVDRQRLGRHVQICLDRYINIHQRAGTDASQAAPDDL